MEENQNVKRLTEVYRFLDSLNIDERKEEIENSKAKVQECIDEIEELDRRFLKDKEVESEEKINAILPCHKRGTYHIEQRAETKVQYKPTFKEKLATVLPYVCGLLFVAAIVFAILWILK